MKYNFGAGPGILPQEVLQEAARAVTDFNSSGLSILEISHRSPDFQAVMDEAQQLVRELLELEAGYSVLFLQGGASNQFAMVPYNLLDEGKTAAYLDTGAWASKAIKEARYFGNVEVVASSKESTYTYVPKDYTLPENAAYFHVTSNNTIYGTQLKEFPVSPVPLVSDMSSDMFSRRIDASRFGLIYAGAQKNMGPAGTTLVVIREDMMGKVERSIPSMLNYKIHAEAGSMYNTPPVYSIYVSMLTLRWIKSLGGVAEIEKRNQAKADLLYKEIDRNPLFKGTAVVEDRSNMNVCFVMEDASLEGEFMQITKDAGCVGIKGHRSVGGFRASIYNALPLETVQVLVDLMKEFETKKG
ncbi:MAG TPA: 3-phosphoserine/phosphohydroxythreonine transaminase [Anseongella sp.]